MDEQLRDQVEHTKNYHCFAKQRRYDSHLDRRRNVELTGAVRINTTTRRWRNKGLRRFGCAVATTPVQPATRTRAFVQKFVVVFLLSFLLGLGYFGGVRVSVQDLKLGLSTFQGHQVGRGSFWRLFSKNVGHARGKTTASLRKSYSSHFPRSAATPIEIPRDSN